MAYGNIKGITIEINGDTSKLTTALKNVDSEARTVRSSLRDIQDSLKYDKSKGPELAAQKQRELARAIENTKEKLEILKKGQAEMSEEFKKTNEGSRAYDNLTREIDKTERQLKSFEAQADKTYQKLTKIRDAATDFGKAAQDVGKSMSRKLTAPILGAGGIVSKFAMDFDSEMSKVKAISGASGDEFDQLRNKARERGAKTKFSATEAAQAMSYMAMAGWDNKQMLDGIDGIMNLAAASGEDLALTSDIVTDAITAFGLSAKDSSHFVDVLAATSSSSNTNVAMMGETFKYAAPIAGTLGYSIEDTALAIGLMANAGIKGSQAGTALRSGLTRLASPTKEVLNGMEMLGLSIEDVQGKPLDETLRIFRNAFKDLDGTQQAQAASLIFGKNAMSGMLGIIQASEGDYNKLSQAISGADGAALDMATTMQDNLGGDLEKLKSAAEELAISFGELLMPALRDVVDKVRDFVDKLNAMPDSTKQVLLDIAGFVAALGPIIWLVGKISSGIGLIAGALAVMQGSMVGATPAMIGLAKMFGGIKTAASALGTFITGHFVPIVIIGVLAAIAYNIYKHWDEIKEYLSNVWESIKEIATSVWTGIKEFFSNIWDGIKEAWAAFWDPIGTWIGEKSQAIVDTVKPIFDTFINVFKVGWMLIEEIFKTAWELISGFFRENWKDLLEIAKMIFNPLKDFITAIWEGIKTATMSVWNAISGWIKGIWKGISYFARPIFDGIKTFISGEIAIECHPGYLQAKDWNELLDCGFNRFSIGVQDLDEHVLKVVNREPSLMPLRDIFGLLRSAGATINLDFLYGLPLQTPESFARNIEAAVELHPDRVVTFSYGHVPWVHKRQLVLEKIGLPEEGAKQRMGANARAIMRQAGYRSIGMDHYVLPEDELSKALDNHFLRRNFQGYCTLRTTGQVYALGVTGISQLSTAYAQNSHDIDGYMANIEAGRLDVRRGYALTHRDQMVREVVENLMCNYHADWKDIAKRMGVSREELREALHWDESQLREMEADGLFMRTEDTLTMTTEGTPFVRNVVAALDPLMVNTTRKFSKPI